MPAVTATSIKPLGKVSVTEVTLDGTAGDVLTYNANGNAILTLRNATAGALTPIIDGDGGSTLSVPNPGLGIVDVSAGYAVGSIPAGEVRAVRLDSIKAFLSGVITITGGTGLVATLYES